MSAMNNPPTTEKKKREKKVVPTCQICVEPYNKSTRLAVQCPYCKFELCRSCCETYALSESEVKCMNPECSKVWTRKMIRDIFTLVFINGALKEHKEKVLFDKERALMPATQPIIEGKLLARRLEKEINELNKEINVIREKQQELILKKQAALNRRSSTERAAFIRKCPEEDCRGFLSTAWKCGVCEKWTCPDCHVVKGYTRDAEHTCNPDDIATAKLLASDTKPCPKCSTSIFKIDGCDQMWCTQCHTAFSWRTGKVETRIHNPHYFEWMRRNGGQAPRNPLDMPCGRNIDHYLVESFRRTFTLYYSRTTNYKEILKKLDTIIRRAMEIRAYELPNAETNYERKHENLRVAYLMKEISEAHMREELQRDDKRHSRDQELIEVYNLLLNTVTDILYRFLDELDRNHSTPPIGQPIDDTTLNEINHIVSYVNECLADISHTYSCSRTILKPDLSRMKGTKAAEHIRELKAAAAIASTNDPPAVEETTLTNSFI